MATKKKFRLTKKERTKRNPKGKISRRIAELRRKFKKFSKTPTDNVSIRSLVRSNIKRKIKMLNDHLKGKIDIFAEIANEKPKTEVLRSAEQQLSLAQIRVDTLKKELQRIVWLKDLVG